MRWLKNQRYLLFFWLVFPKHISESDIIWIRESINIYRELHTYVLDNRHTLLKYLFEYRWKQRDWKFKNIFFLHFHFYYFKYRCSHFDVFEFFFLSPYYIYLYVRKLTKVQSFFLKRFKKIKVDKKITLRNHEKYFFLISQSIKNEPFKLLYVCKYVNRNSTIV